MQIYIERCVIRMYFEVGHMARQSQYCPRQIERRGGCTIVHDVSPLKSCEKPDSHGNTVSGF
jgi:hypothetical protein